MIELVLLFTGLSTALATVAAVAAVRARRIRVVPRLRIERIEHDYADLAERHALLHATVKRLQSRISMRDAREKRHETPTATNAQADGESPEEWKTRMRRQLAASKLGAPNNGGAN